MSKVVCVVPTRYELRYLTLRPDRTFSTSRVRSFVAALCMDRRLCFSDVPDTRGRRESCRKVSQQSQAAKRKSRTCGARLFCLFQPRCSSSSAQNLKHRPATRIVQINFCRRGFLFLRLMARFFETCGVGGPKVVVPEMSAVFLATAYVSGGPFASHVMSEYPLLSR